MAQQIIDLDNQGKIAPNEPILRQILLQPEVKNKKVCVVSITGTFRQGKSFLLNFFIRYLTLKYKSEKWLNIEDGNISGFAWKCGSDRHTVGILMWSEIFLAKLPSGEEVAIVLLDTQGTFDNESSKQQCAGIFAISTLISSVQIYNLKDKINQFDLEHLECFSGYGQLAVDENLKSNKSPFQNLCFLIRDWQYSFQKSFGANGGQELLNEVSTGPDQPLELKRQCENIWNLFEKITCFLLPFPGDKVAKDPSFLGNLSEVDPDFLKHVEEFVPTILATENLVPKVINGETISVSDLFHFIQNYCQYFSKHEVPQLKSMFMVTAETHLKIASEESEGRYQNSMDFLLDTSEAVDACDLLEKHEIEKTNAVACFKNKKSFGNEELKRYYQRILEQKLNEKFLLYNQLNAGRLAESVELAKQKKRHQAERLAQQKQLEDQFQEDYNEQRLMLESQIESTQNELQRWQQSRGERSRALRPGLRSRIAALDEPLPENRKNFIKKGFDYVRSKCCDLVVEGIAMVRGPNENYNRSVLRPEDN